jgi:hypothetical protein
MSSTIDSDDKILARDAFAAFLRDACEHADDSHWYSIRGTYSDHSLCLLTFLDPCDYATMLYVAGLLNVKGRTMTTSDNPIWNDFLKEQQLGDGGATGAAEATKSRVDVNKLIETRLRPRGENRKDNYFLRVGHHSEVGETTTACDQLHSDIPAPLLSHYMRNAQRKLALSLTPILEKYSNTRGALVATDWVKWSAIDEYSLVPVEEQDIDPENSDSETGSEAEEEEMPEEEEAPVTSTINANNSTATLISTPSTVNASSAVMLSSPSAAGIQHYPPDHPNSKYPLLNSLNYNLMDRSTQSASIRSSSQMDGLVREIKDFKQNNNEKFVIESMNSRVKKLVEVP